MAISIESDTIKPKLKARTPNLPKPKPKPKDEPIYQLVQDMPTFPTCDNNKDEDRKCTVSAIEAFLNENLEYPEYAYKNGVEGTCVISFIVEKDGSLSDFKIVRNVGAGMGEEALRVLKMLPNFKPGEQRGKPVRVQQNIPVRFRITPGLKTEMKAKKKARKKAEKARRKAERKKKK